MRQAKVLYKNKLSGWLTQSDSGNFVFRYTDHWFSASNAPAISLTLPKTQQEHHSTFLFPFFFNLLPEGSNKQMVCYHQRIDPKDDFGLLMNTGHSDTIGAVTVIKMDLA